MSKVYYLSGPMTNCPDFNFPAFDRMEKFLVSQGHTVVNPANTSRRLGPELPWVEYIKADLDEMYKLAVEYDQDVTLFQLPGWGSSVGATIEYMIAVSWNWNLDSFKSYADTKITTFYKEENLEPTDSNPETGEPETCPNS